MRNSFKSIGKVATLLASTALLMATTAIIPAEAANKAGGSCSKVNAKARIGGDSYVCTKNPTVKNAKLTWPESKMVIRPVNEADKKATTNPLIASLTSRFKNLDFICLVCLITEWKDS